jgi:hypothetical protein
MCIPFSSGDLTYKTFLIGFRMSLTKKALMIIIEK